MEKKLRRDFKERQEIKEEAKLLGKEYMDADEVGKLKHGDDYRGNDYPRERQVSGQDPRKGKQKKFRE